MPHDATPDNGRMRPFGAPSWNLGLALAAILALAVALVAAVTGMFLFALPAIAVVVVGYGAYRAVANRWRRALPRDFRRPRAARNPAVRSKWSVVADARARRRRSRLDAPDVP